MARHLSCSARLVLAEEEHDELQGQGRSQHPCLPWAMWAHHAAGNDIRGSAACPRLRDARRDWLHEKSATCWGRAVCVHFGGAEALDIMGI